MLNRNSLVGSWQSNCNIACDNKGSKHQRSAYSLRPWDEEVLRTGWRGVCTEHRRALLELLAVFAALDAPERSLCSCDQIKLLKTKHPMAEVSCAQSFQMHRHFCSLSWHKQTRRENCQQFELFYQQVQRLRSLTCKPGNPIGPAGPTGPGKPFGPYKKNRGHIENM